MNSSYDMRCKDQERRQLVKSKCTLNGIDYVEIQNLKSDLSDKCYSLLLVYCFKKASEIVADNINIEGGTLVRNIRVVWVKTNDKIKRDILNGQNYDPDGEEFPEDKLRFVFSQIEQQDLDRMVLVRTDKIGDFSPYTLRFVSKINPSLPLEKFDPMLSSIEISFRSECSQQIDCKSEKEDTCFSITSIEEPDINIDYMAKDFASFRRLILDRLSLIIPEWREKNIADVGMVLVELIAYVSDHLGYYQDAVATEAYLGTARNRISMKRHLRLLNYELNEGSNSRTWVCFEVEQYRDAMVVPKKTKLLTRGNDDLVSSLYINEEDLEQELKNGSQVFETLYDIQLYNAHNSIEFYTWGNRDCCLPKGSTCATLRNDGKELHIQPGDVLIFEETSSRSISTTRTTATGSSKGDNAHKSHRCHAVRIKKVHLSKDELYDPPVDVLNIIWMEGDSLPFPLYISKTMTETTKDGRRSDGPECFQKIGIARGNVVAADQGYTITDEFVGSTPKIGRFYPKLRHKPLTFRRPAYHSKLPAEYLTSNNIEETFPDIYLKEVIYQSNLCKNGELEHILQGTSDIISPSEVERIWNVKKDLLEFSDESEFGFVVEVDNDQTVFLRFGDGDYGMKPINSTENSYHCFYATYHVDNRSVGNVGAETISRIVRSDQFNLAGITRVGNPISAIGGFDSESLDEIRKTAVSEALNRLGRAVTEDDYVAILKRHREIRNVIATIENTGSWDTVVITIDRLFRKEVDTNFKNGIIKYLNKFRLAGYDIEVKNARYVSLYIVIRVCISQNQSRNEVERVLQMKFSNKEFEGGVRGLFHPDNFTFGQPIYLSKIFEIAASVEGVVSVNVDRFQPLGTPSDNNELEKGVIELARDEIIILDNDLNYPENGIIKFQITGGL